MLRNALPLAFLLLTACASTAPSSSPSPSSTGASPTSTPSRAGEASPELEERALLALLADRRMVERVTLEQTMKGSPGLRRELAVTLGRVGDRQARFELQELLFDDAPEVRRAAAFALGEMGDERARRPLLRAAAGEDSATGGLAVEALGKLGTAVMEVSEALAALPAEESWRRLLPHLFRFDEAATVTLAEEALAVSDGELRGRAVYALARNPRPEALPRLRTLVEAADPWSRALVARALGRIGERQDLARLRPLLDDPEPGPTIQALAAAARLLEAGTAAAPEGWVPRLRELLDDSRPQVRLASLPAAAYWLFDDTIFESLLGRLEDPLEGGEALVAIARGEHGRAAELVTAAAASRTLWRRAAAARAAVFLDDPELLDRLLRDPQPRVRVRALESFLARAVVTPEAVAERVGEILARDTDPAMRSVAFGWAVDHPLIPIEVLGEAAVFALGDRNIESSLAAVRALAARGETESLDRGAVVALLEKMAELSDFTVRRSAGQALAALGRPAPPTGSAKGLGDTLVYREIIQRSAAARFVRLRSDAGDLVLRLDCPQAPRTCLSFLSLSAQGFFDGLTFHRVVPDFVVQGGDPRGDGFGGPGFTLRDEINSLRYERGTVGMALAGPDTGGSQFFIALSRQPHLDGGYTVFGQVVDGDEVLDLILPGTRILGIDEITGADVR
ncbi:MAG: peptidylprolyl isomerase [Acidobacteriota bacterium]